MQIMLLLTKDAIEPLAKNGEEFHYEFTKVRLTTYKSDADAAYQLASENEMGKIDGDPM